MRATLSKKIGIENEFEIQLTQQERWWFREGKKAYMETENVMAHIDQVIKKI
jgi:hypothetical protein